LNRYSPHNVPKTPMFEIDIPAVLLKVDAENSSIGQSGVTLFESFHSGVPIWILLRSTFCSIMRGNKSSTNNQRSSVSSHGVASLDSDIFWIIFLALNSEGICPMSKTNRIAGDLAGRALLRCRRSKDGLSASAYGISS